ncbi:protein kinase [Flavobacterium sp. J27]|uniref:protein kinase domain-containing protein n=1 Tax=Flavobacterium sp. J27 TaxID=2060419 RepID=UPI001030C13E|nr:protein kinase [Flavobacterium sp. J27]
MKTIQITTFLSTDLFPDFNNVKSIEIEDKPIAEGAFGEVYICTSINNQKTSVPQVVKIFKEDYNNKQQHNVDTIIKLQNKINKKNQELLLTNKTLLNEYPALKGIPQFSFSGKLNGKEIRGFSSTNLKRIGFEEFVDILEDDTLYKEYQGLDIQKKMLISYHFVSAFKLLNDLFFIHADLKPEAIFVNIAKNECAIIDFDSGTITENISDEPNVWGAPNDWVAPEIWEQLKQVNINGLQKIKVNLLSDLWSVAVGIHYFLTTTHPLYYLKELSPIVSNDYFLKYKWPEIDKKESYFNVNNGSIYEPIKNWLNNVLPKSIFNEFYNTINYGYKNPIKRTTYNEWEKVLLSIQEPPKILLFEADRDIIIDGISVVLKWDIIDCYQIFLNDGSSEFDITNSFSIDLNPSEDTEYRIKAVGYFGTTYSELIKIRVFPVPQIKVLQVPIPEFNMNLNLSNLNISSPNLNFKVDLNSDLFQLEKVDFIGLSNEAKLNFLSKREKSNSISKVFDKISKKINN